MTIPNQAPKAAAGLYIRLADLLVAAGALVILLFSWAPTVSGFYGSTFGRSLWTWVSPLGIFVIIGVVALIGTALADVWWKRDAPMVGLHRHHVQVGIALFVLIDIVGLAFASIGGVSPGIGFGGVIQLLGALVATAGAVLNFFNQLQNPIGMPSVSVSAPHSYPPANSAPASPTDPTV